MKRLRHKMYDCRRRFRTACRKSSSRFVCTTSTVMELYHDTFCIAFSIVIVLKPLTLNSTGISQFPRLSFLDSITSLGRQRGARFMQGGAKLLAVIGTSVRALAFYITWPHDSHLKERIRTLVAKLKF